MAQPPDHFLADVYRHVPFLVVHLSVEGVILHCNPATEQLTGYDERDLVGKNFWGLLFPGRLFTQVPRFVSPTHPTGVAKDVPMTILTRDGRERILALSRYVHINGGPDSAAADASDTSRRTLICVGIDLTDRLLDAERDQLPQQPDDPTDGLISFGPHIGNAGAIDGEFVTPLAISPPRPAGESTGGSLGTARGPIDQAFDFLHRIEEELALLQAVVAEGRLHVMTALAETMLERRVRAFELVARGDWLNLEETRGDALHLQARAEETVALYRKDTL